MNREQFMQITGFLVLVVSSILLLNPFHFWMPDMVHMTILGVVVASFGSVSALILREVATDEREEMHAMFAGRAAFFAGTSVLVCGIVIQTFAHAIDPWLVFALLSMVCAKIVSRFWAGAHM
ncbi:MAG: hypothetical protein RIQ56_476 [Candidatus Parcubacteria bacterium]|jgi:hypothetical protein